MRRVPFDPGDALVLVLAALIPLAPLMVTVSPLDRLLTLVSKMVC